MKSLTLLCLLSFAVLSAGSLAGRNLLLRRDEVPQDSTGEMSTDPTQEVFVQTVKTYSQTVKSIEVSCNQGNTQEVYASISVLETSMKRVQEVTLGSDFDANAANTYKTSVVQLISTYSIIVSVLSSYTEVEEGCHNSLQSITRYTQTVVNVYANFGICMAEEVKNAGSFNEQAFVQLGLQLNLRGQASSTTTQEVTNPKPSDGSGAEGE
ncbi:hypothetical protein CROQUDRAFT_672915 [Cronartium quercuum f. sp. fusiforme G11]|uniref:Secreted protein n=1 Tax=Cronartium quercuum f. sp. fusiforme G11 TaxID=708437 RepID=A0A9P6NCD0_9BASI|nr:hypothetical protein CROQUDRAFT_672915 [Cronartium quercuum f. sp. fusiforme G11]